MTADDPTLPPDDEREDSPGEDEEGAPPPATWAGRKRTGESEPGAGPPDAQGDQPDAQGDQPDSPSDQAASPSEGGREVESWGFTDELDEVERELGASLDDGERAGVEDGEGADLGAGVESADEASDAGDEDGVEDASADADGNRADGGEVAAAGAAAGGEPDVAGDGAEGDADGDGADAESADEGPEAGTGADGEDVVATSAAAPTQETVEADTLALADREAAEEAALAGLKARAVRKGATDGAGPPPQAVPVPPPAAVAEAATDSAKPDRAEAEAEAARDAPRPKALWVRFLVASLVIVASMATATSVTALMILTDLAEGIGGIEDVEQELEPVDGGDPQTLLILGSDQRLGLEGGDEAGARSDTAMLLRVDPDRDAIALLSIPRDLKVNIPGVGVRKFNEAYSYGGPKLTLKTVKQLTDRQIDINHVVNINFTGFADAVNAIDCVFIDVDRRYYVPEGSEYSAIDPPIEAGYQRLCGLKALQYVRFRLDDNDLVRAARQQDFLREARQKIPPSRLWSDRDELIEIFKEYTTSSETLANPIQLLELMKTFLAARGGTVNEVQFPAQLGDAASIYVTANQKAVQETVREFLNAGVAPADQPPGSGSSAGDGGDGRGAGGGKGAKSGDKDESKPDEGPPMTADYNPIIVEHAQRVADTTSPSGKRVILDFPLFYPTEVPASTNLNPLEASRAFPIDGPGDEVYEGYKLVFGLPGDAGFTEYWGVSGTNWRDPPILENPTDVKEIDGREYLRFYDGSRLRLVGWKQGGRSYWVNNTLLQTLGDVEMMAIARSMARLDG